MNKAELIEALADKTGYKSKKQRKYWMLTSRS